MYQCDCCGKCCRNLSLSSLYTQLDRGDGTCRYLQENLCSIYENRPIICRVDECYEVYFKDIVTLEQYYELNYEACKLLKNKF
ncbi:MAG: YkgJ family cysteine cluster protein [Eubacteriales bacterium]